MQSTIYLCAKATVYACWAAQPGQPNAPILHVVSLRWCLVQVVELQTALATEQVAHRRAVQQYVDALDARSEMQLQLQASQEALAELSSAHQALGQQHQLLQEQYGGLLGQCTVVRDIFRGIDDALELDTQLAQQFKQWEAQTLIANEPVSSTSASQQQDQQQQPAEQELQPDQGQQEEGSSTAVDSAPDMQPLAERLDRQVQAMYASWRCAVNARDVALTERFRMADQLRDAEEAHYQMQQQQKAMQQTAQEVQQQLSSSQVGHLSTGMRSHTHEDNYTGVQLPSHLLLKLLPRIPILFGL